MDQMDHHHHHLIEVILRRGGTPVRAVVGGGDGTVMWADSEAQFSMPWHGGCNVGGGGGFLCVLCGKNG